MLPKSLTVYQIVAKMRKAESGDATAQAKLGQMYAEGKGMPQDYVEAMKWFRLAADQGWRLFRTC